MIKTAQRAVEINQGKYKAAGSDLAPLMVVMAGLEGSGVQADSEPQKQFLFELFNTLREYAPRSLAKRAEVVTGPTGDEGRDMVEAATMARDYANHSLVCGVNIKVSQQLAPKAYQKVKTAMTEQMTFHIGVLGNFKRKPPAYAVEKEVELGPLGRLVQRSEDGKEDMLNGEVLHTIYNFGHAMAAAGAREIELTATGATHEVANSTAGRVLKAGEPVTYYFHYNEFAQLFERLLDLSARHGPMAIKKGWTHVLTLANDIAIEQGCNLSTALVVAQRREPLDGILSQYSRTETAPTKSAPNQGGNQHRGGDYRTKPSCYDFNSKQGCLRGGACKFLHQCGRCGHPGHNSFRCPMERERSRSKSPEHRERQKIRTDHHADKRGEVARDKRGEVDRDDRRGGRDRRPF